MKIELVYLRILYLRTSLKLTVPREDTPNIVPYFSKQPLLPSPLHDEKAVAAQSVSNRKVPRSHYRNGGIHLLLQPTHLEQGHNRQNFRVFRRYVISSSAAPSM